MLSSSASRARGSRDDVDDPAFLFEQVIFIYFPSKFQSFSRGGRGIVGRSLIIKIRWTIRSGGSIIHGGNAISNEARVLLPVEV